MLVAGGVVVSSITCIVLCAIPVVDIAIAIVACCAGAFAVAQIVTLAYQEHKRRKLTHLNEQVSQWKHSADKIAIKLDKLHKDAEKIEYQCLELTRSIASQSTMKSMLDDYDLDTDEEVKENLDKLDQSLVTFSSDCKTLLTKIAEAQRNLRK